MAEKQKTTLEMADSKQVSLSGQANGGNGHYSSSGLLSWYFAQPPIAGPTYVLTTTGYVVPSSRN